MSVQIYSPFSQARGERQEGLLGGSKKGSHTVRLPPRALGCHKRHEKVSPFVKFEKILHLLCFRAPYKKALQDMEFYDKLMDRFQGISKVKNPAVSKTKI